jgi:hypothetical protein
MGFRATQNAGDIHRAGAASDLMGTASRQPASAETVIGVRLALDGSEGRELVRKTNGNLTYRRPPGGAGGTCPQPYRFSWYGDLPSDSAPMPVSLLFEAREFDRAHGQEHAHLDEARWLAFVEDVRANGIREHVVLDWDSVTGKAYLCEGNHRLAAAMELGLTEMPCRAVAWAPRNASNAVLGSSSSRRRRCSAANSPATAASTTPPC